MAAAAAAIASEVGFCFSDSGVCILSGIFCSDSFDFSNGFTPALLVESLLLAGGGDTDGLDGLDFLAKFDFFFLQ